MPDQLDPAPPSTRKKRPNRNRANPRPYRTAMSAEERRERGKIGAAARWSKETGAARSASTQAGRDAAAARFYEAAAALGIVDEFERELNVLEQQRESMARARMAKARARRLAGRPGAGGQDDEPAEAGELAAARAAEFIADNTGRVA